MKMLKAIPALLIIEVRWVFMVVTKQDEDTVIHSETLPGKVKVCLLDKSPFDFSINNLA